MKKSNILASTLATILVLSGCNTHPDNSDSNVDINITKVGAYNTNLKAGSEIVAYDKTSKRMFTTNGADNSIDIVDIADITNPTLISSINLDTYGNGVNSVAVKNSIVAVAVQDGNNIVGTKQLKGNVVFFDTNGMHLHTVEAGFLPDMVTFNEDGLKVLVANEGEPNGAYTIDPEGSIGVINVLDYTYTNVKLNIPTEDSSDGTKVRLGGTPSNNQMKDLEPEYIAVSGNYAYITLQENNAIAKLNLTTNTLEYIKSLGAKSWEEASNNTIDIEEEGTMSMKSYKGLFSLYQPDSIASYISSGKTYLVTANEGDGREYCLDTDTDCDNPIFVDEKKISKLTLDSSIENEYINENDLKVMVDIGDTDNDGDYDKLYAFGARSFSIWDENGNLVWDSGDTISKKVAEFQADLFNQDEGKMDGRSGNKGAEPEALTVGTIHDKTFAFIGLERQNAIIVYDITDPKAPIFKQYYETETKSDISPEGMKFIPASESPNKKDLLLVSYELSGSTAIYEITK